MHPEKPETIPFLMGILIHVLGDTARQLNIRLSSFDRDIASLQVRSRSEGLSFFTKTLPLLAKALDRALATDEPFVCPLQFAGKAYGDVVLPVLFGRLWKFIFRRDGMLKASDLDGESHYVPSLTDVSDCTKQIVAVRAIRQIGYLAYKLEGSHSTESEAATIEKFISIDRSLWQVEEDIPLPLWASQALENARMLIWYAIHGLDPLDILPKHGPGALATGEKPWEKFNFRRFYPHLDEVYGYPDYFFFNMDHLCECLESLEGMETCSEATAKVVLVPKDSRGPRLISMEPLELQWIQQGLSAAIVRKLESSGNITCGFVNFTNQEINRNLALGNSNGSGAFITLDLKDASDLVSLWLVRKLFPLHVYKALFACRSHRTRLPDGHCLSLNKFAPMGSACCFPIEALVFWALAVGSLKAIRKFGDLSSLPPVYVYGDDIVLRREDYERVRPVFEFFQLEFSDGKCCTGRFFRESCGMDAFKGHPVTPLRIKQQISDRLSPKALLSLVSFANSIGDGERGYSETRYYVENYIREHFGPLPIKDRIDGFTLAFYHKDCSSNDIRNSLTPFKRRYNSLLHRYEIKLPIINGHVFKREQSPEWSSLFSLTQMGPPDPFGFECKRLLGEFTQPHVTKLRWSWVCEDLLRSNTPS